MGPRTVQKIVVAREQSEGVGARVRRSIGNGVSVDPFLMLDEFKGARPAGFPDHPHRGMMTVTYVMLARTRVCCALLVVLCIWRSDIGRRSRGSGCEAFRRHLR
jgi:hypothetical protein